MADNYPPGAKYDKNAPWLKDEPTEMVVSVEVSQTLTTTVSVTVPIGLEEDRKELLKAVKEQVYLPSEIIERQRKFDEDRTSIKPIMINDWKETDLDIS